MSGPDALEYVAAAQARELTNGIQQSQKAHQGETEVAELSHKTILLISGAVLLAVLAFRKLAEPVGNYLNRCYNPWGEAPSAAPDLAAEEKTFSEYAVTFTTGPKPVIEAPTAEASAPSATTQRAPSKEQAKPKADAPLDFVQTAKKDLVGIREIFGQASRAEVEFARQQLLASLFVELGNFTKKASAPELLPVWQMTCTIEGLVKQLADRPQNVSPSALRTIAGALDLLSGLCVRGLKPDLASNPPVRVLAVDDDAVCRHAVSFALRKVFTQPDLASDGESALKSAETNAYDAIFLDVEMPGMDGFELCARIHGTSLNQTTPVVFVTRHNDFNARAASSLLGGQDLIAKPFLAFELALKALTLVLRRRLAPNRSAPQAQLSGEAALRLAESMKPAFAKPAEAAEAPA